MRYSLVTLSVILAAGLAQAQDASPTRSAIDQRQIKVDEAASLDVIRGELQRNLNDFVGRITVLNRDVTTTSRNIRDLCNLIYGLICLHQSPQPPQCVLGQITVPTPEARPNEIIAFCNTVINIPDDGNGTIPTITTPFLAANVPPVCNPQTEDLIWTGVQWQCRTTVLPASCNNPGAQPPQWVQVN